MRTIVSFMVYLLIFLLLGGVIYFFAFWRPQGNRVEQLNQEIYDARAELAVAISRDEMSPELLYEVERLGHELSQAQSDWESVYRDWQYNYVSFLPEVFNEADMRERIYRIATPHSHSLNVYFQYSQPFGVRSNSYPYGLPEGIWLTPVNVSFTAGFEGIMAILYGFANEGIDNRIVEYTLSRNGDQWEVGMRLDILTQFPQPYRYNAPHG
ncbi:MAG: hypothetical protein FWC77_03585 [Defluviitaleaceae bacterium]|nr:hypothetical protein [Defluviitaleaceae bacterium]